MNSLGFKQHILGNQFHYLEQQLGNELVETIPTVPLPSDCEQRGCLWKDATELKYDVVKFVLPTTKRPGLAIRYYDKGSDQLQLEIFVQKHPKKNSGQKEANHHITWESTNRLPNEHSICKTDSCTKGTFEIIKNIIEGKPTEQTNGKYLPCKKEQVFSQFFAKKFGEFFDFFFEVEVPKNYCEGDYPRIYSKTDEPTLDAVKGIFPSLRPFVVFRWFDVKINQLVLAQIMPRYSINHPMTINVIGPKNAEMILSDTYSNNKRIDYNICYMQENGQFRPAEPLTKRHIKEIKAILDAKPLEETGGKFLPSFKPEFYSDEMIEEYQRKK